MGKVEKYLFEFWHFVFDRLMFGSIERFSLVEIVDRFDSIVENNLLKLSMEFVRFSMIEFHHLSKQLDRQDLTMLNKYPTKNKNHFRSNSICNQRNCL